MPTAQGVRMRYLALGDSYTIGEDVESPARWPEQLAATLCAQGIALDPPEILATTGWTTDELAAAIAAHRFTPPYDLVSLLIGVNDQYRGRSLDEYRPPFAQLLDTAIRFAGDSARRVIVVSIPDWGTTPFAASDPRGRALIGAQIDAFNAAAREITQTRGAHFIDITAISRSSPADETGWLADDGLHPGSAQYAAWAAAIAAAVRHTRP